MLTAAPMIAVCFNPLAATLSAPAAAVAAAPEGALAPTLVGSYGSDVGVSASAGLGAAASVGKLSVPPSWVTKSPEIRLVATALPTTSMGESYGGMPLVGPVTSVVNAPRGDGSRVRSAMRAKVLAGPDEELGNRRGPDRGPDGDPLSERDELNQLRKTATQLAKQRDVLKRTAATLIQESREK
ncbi:PE/PPE C-terminal domain-containing protein [Mycobacterium riyadhense]|nr:PE/PPE C-terminal domain-containing protein [Mycobacterium riyadhense]